MRTDIDYPASVQELHQRAVALEVADDEVVTIAEWRTEDLVVVLTSYDQQNSCDISVLDVFEDRTEYRGVVGGSWPNSYPEYLDALQADTLWIAGVSGVVETALGLVQVGAGLAGAAVDRVLVTWNTGSIEVAVHPDTRAFVFDVRTDAPIQVLRL